MQYSFSQTFGRKGCLISDSNDSGSSDAMIESVFNQAFMENSHSSKIEHPLSTDSKLIEEWRMRYQPNNSTSISTRLRQKQVVEKNTKQKQNEWEKWSGVNKNNYEGRMKGEMKRGMKREERQQFEFSRENQATSKQKKIEELGVRMKKLLTELRNDEKCSNQKMKRAHEQQKQSFKRPYLCQKNIEFDKKGPKYCRSLNHQRVKISETIPSCTMKQLNLISSNYANANNNQKEGACFPLQHSIFERSIEARRFMQGKIKTIESEGWLDVQQQSQSYLQELSSIDSHKMNGERSGDDLHDNGAKNRENEHGLQEKIKQITFKIDEYQRRVQKMQANEAQSKNNNKDHRGESETRNGVNLLNYKNCSHLSRNEDQFRLLHGQNGHIEAQKARPNHQNSNIGPSKQLFHKDSYDIPNSVNSKDKLHATRQSFSKSISTSTSKTSDLKSRMSKKLGLRSCQQKLLTQINLDEELRRAKKQFSKLPEQTASINDKWHLLSRCLQSNFNSPKYCVDELKQIFRLCDQEADPFFSVAIDGHGQYQTIILNLSSAYSESEHNFSAHILNNFSKQELEQILEVDTTSESFSKTIKLDEFTLLLSNATKTNLKCRDAYLLYNRLLKAEKQESTLKLKNLWQLLLSQSCY